MNRKQNERKGEKSREEKKERKPFLASSIPNLSFDNFTIDVQGPGGELDTNGGFRLEVKLVLSESGEQIGLADTGVPNQNHLE